MSRRNLRKSLAVLALAAALALPLAQPAAAARAQRTPRPAPVSLWGQAWGWLTSLVEKEGSCVDPNGVLCGRVSQQPYLDAGGCVDPDGRQCTPSAAAGQAGH
jgi:hypothetical protein